VRARTARRALACATLLALAALGTACTTRAVAHKTSIALVPADRMEGELVLRQKLRFRYAERAGSLDAVVQVHCRKLAIVGLSPMGTRVFSITQQGDVIAVESLANAVWPFPPEQILQAVHRSFLLPMARPPRLDGAHAVTVGAIELVEVWEGGALIERRFPDGPDGRASVTVRYAGERHPPEIASRVALHDEALGYHLEIETISVERLRCDRELFERK
jgi:hypothetical protein